MPGERQAARRPAPRGAPRGAPSAARRAQPQVGRPPLPDDIDIAALEPSVRAELRTLPRPCAQEVAGHLLMAARHVEDDPVLALEHARAARSLAPRLGVVRETAGVAAYRAGAFAEALAELRTARRMTGSPDVLPMLADCERGLGRPERAIELARTPEARRLDQAGQVEMKIVESGARRDLGEAAAAVLVLEGPELEPASVMPWTLRLWYAYGAALLGAGRRAEAATWFGAVVELDDDEDTDARERLEQLSS